MKPHNNLFFSFRVPCRSLSSPIQVLGTFPGALVTRGHDWDWADQDGGMGSRGVVKLITNWNEESWDSVASVLWPNGRENLYRLGHKGKVDVCCVSPTSGGMCYVSHLPLFGKPVLHGPTFAVGQTVQVFVDLDTLKRLQVGHGEFREEMKEVVGRRGRVHRLTDKGDVRVQFPGNPAKDHRWTLNPLAIQVGCNVGDRVTVTSDKGLVERYHQNIAALEGFLGCTGTITHVHSENSLVIDFGNGRVGAMHQGILLKTQQQEYYGILKKHQLLAHFRKL